MNKFVEILKDNRVLDVIKARGTVEDLPIAHLQDYMVRIEKGNFEHIGEYLGQITAGKYRLIIVWGGDFSERLRDCDAPMLYGKEEDERIRKYIPNNVEIAFYQAIDKYDDYIYVLNIATHECFGNFSWAEGWSKDLLNQQLDTFMPIIQKFIADAVTNSLTENKCL